MSKKEFRHFNLADTVIGHIDKALNNVFIAQHTQRDFPAQDVAEGDLTAEQKKHAAGLMRVNHAGEIAAQALYHGQSLMARDVSLKDKLKHASEEEADHLNWCRTRLDELDAKPSVFDPAWYLGSLAIGMAAGAIGDRWNLGFLAETEHQVVSHLQEHLEQLPQSDKRSRAIVEQMKTDELGHAHLAEDLGAAKLPDVVKSGMRLTSKLMTSVSEKI
jgi:ubiquinone biosynthesis monooxygenase Coq7